MSARPIHFLGNSLTRLRGFPSNIRRDAGYQLDRLQHGLRPSDFKPMPGIGIGVEELRLRDESGAYRIIYCARRKEAIYVVHAFQKKTSRTAHSDIQLARQRFALLKRGKP